MGSIISTMMAILFFIFGPQLASLYSSIPEVISNASKTLKIIAFVQPFQSSQLILSGGLRELVILFGLLYQLSLGS